MLLWCCARIFREQKCCTFVIFFIIFEAIRAFFLGHLRKEESALGCGNYAL
jgi:hypothetical protein